VQVIDELLDVPLALPVLPLAIENVGEIEPLGEQLAVSSVIVEPKLFVIVVKLAVTCADAAPAPAIANAAARSIPEQNLETAFKAPVIVVSFNLQMLHHAACLVGSAFYAKHRELADNANCPHRHAETGDDSVSVSTTSFAATEKDVVFPLTN
jgi:hypothetical protein